MAAQIPRQQQIRMAVQIPRAAMNEAGCAKAEGGNE